MSDIFADYSFGGWLRRWRLDKRVGLRELARAIDKDPSTICKIEKSEFPPPDSREKILALVKPLKLNKDQIDMLVSLALQDRLATVRKRFSK